MTEASLRWLGVAGMEISVGRQTILVDPFLTRPPLLNLFFGRPRTNRELIARRLGAANYILVTHSHYDHLMDVPYIAQQTGALVVGPPNACQILQAYGIPARQICRVHAGNEIHLGTIQVLVTHSDHIREPFACIFDGPLKRRLRKPLRLRDFRMDESLGFWLRAGDLRVLFGAEPHPADVWILNVHRAEQVFAEHWNAVNPQVTIPVHWDDFFLPAERKLHKMLRPPEWGRPFISRQDPIDLVKVARQLAPGVKVVVPEIFRTIYVESRPVGEAAV